MLHKTSKEKNEEVLMRKQQQQEKEEAHHDDDAPPTTSLRYDTTEPKLFPETWNKQSRKGLRRMPTMNQTSSGLLEERQQETATTMVLQDEEEMQRRSLQEEDEEECVSYKALTTIYNDNPEVAPYVGIMFGMTTKASAITVRTLELDVRFDLMESTDDMNVEVYTMLGDFALAAQDESKWTLVAATNLVASSSTNSEQGGGVLIPTQHFTPISMGPNEKHSLYVTFLRKNCTCLDYTVYALDKTGEVANSGPDFDVLVGSGLKDYKFVELDTMVDPKFTGVVHYEKACDTSQIITTTVEYQFLFNSDPGININNIVDRTVDAFIESNPVLKAYEQDHMLMKTGQASTMPVEYTGGCPVAWKDGCMSSYLSTKIGFEHQATLTSEDVLFELYQAPNQIAEAIIANLPSNVQLFYLGLKSGLANYQMLLNGVPNGVLMDAIQQQYYAETTQQFLHANAPPEVVVYGVHVDSQAFGSWARRRRQRRRLRGLQQQASDMLTVTGLMKGVQYAYVADPFAATIDSVFTAANDDDAEYLDMLKTNVLLPGPINEGNSGAYFQGITSYDTFFEIDDQGGGGGGGGSKGGGGTNTVLVAVGAIVAVVGVAIVALLVFLYIKKKRKEQGISVPDTDQSDASSEHSSESTYMLPTGLNRAEQPKLLQDGSAASAEAPIDTVERAPQGQPRQPAVRDKAWSFDPWEEDENDDDAFLLEGGPGAYGAPPRHQQMRNNTLDPRLPRPPTPPQDRQPRRARAHSFDDSFPALPPQSRGNSFDDSFPHHRPNQERRMSATFRALDLPESPAMRRAGSPGGHYPTPAGHHPMDRQALRDSLRRSASEFQVRAPPPRRTKTPPAGGRPGPPLRTKTPPAQQRSPQRTKTPPSQQRPASPFRTKTPPAQQRPGAPLRTKTSPAQQRPPQRTKTPPAQQQRPGDPPQRTKTPPARPRGGNPSLAGYMDAQQRPADHHASGARTIGPGAAAEGRREPPSRATSMQAQDRSRTPPPRAAAKSSAPLLSNHLKSNSDHRPRGGHSRSVGGPEESRQYASERGPASAADPSSSRPYESEGRTATAAPPSLSNHLKSNSDHRPRDQTRYVGGPERGGEQSRPYASERGPATVAEPPSSGPYASERGAHAGAHPPRRQLQRSMSFEEPPTRSPPARFQSGEPNMQERQFPDGRRPPGRSRSGGAARPEQFGQRRDDRVAAPSQPSRFPELAGSHRSLQPDPTRRVPNRSRSFDERGPPGGAPPPSLQAMARNPYSAAPPPNAPSRRPAPPNAAPPGRTHSDVSHRQAAAARVPPPMAFSAASRERAPARVISDGRPAAANSRLHRPTPGNDNDNFPRQPSFSDRSVEAAEGGPPILGLPRPPSRRNLGGGGTAPGQASRPVEPRQPARQQPPSRHKASGQAPRGQQAHPRPSGGSRPRTSNRRASSRMETL